MGLLVDMIGCLEDDTIGVSDPPKGAQSHAKSYELKCIVKIVSEHYGGDDEVFLAEYIEAVMVNNDLDVVLDCFRKLAEKLPSVNNRELTGDSL